MKMCVICWRSVILNVGGCFRASVVEIIISQQIKCEFNDFIRLKIYHLYYFYVTVSSMKTLVSSC